MPKRLPKSKKLDTNELAFRTLQIATGEIPNPDKQSDAAMAARGRQGGLKGGKARMRKLSPGDRSKMGRAAARKRWKGRD